MRVTRHRWTAKQRAEIFRDNDGICHLCTRKIAPGEVWHVEHPKARGLGGSDKQKDVKPAHEDCHKPKTKADRAIMTKADRQAKAYHGLKAKRSRPMPGSKASGFRKRMDGTVERRT
jgi:5-methylcytosine-specific restriction protein A